MSFLVAAPASGSGKTVTTTGILAALARRGVPVAPAKVGPDYIDPGYLAAAARVPAVNLDLWAMRPALARHLARRAALVVEGVMGLFDGPSSGSGSSADVAKRFGLPVVLVVNAERQSHSVAALVHGFATFDPKVRLAGVILTRVASPRHAAMLGDALSERATPLLGMIPRDAALALPSRHLGLTQAVEDPDLAARIAAIADVVAAHCDLDALASLATAAPETPDAPDDAGAPPPLPPFGSRIAIARDAAFAFAYPHLLDGWHRAGASLHPFSPLAGEAPDGAADAIFLPGGYPELHAGSLAAAPLWRDGLVAAARRGAVVYGECGGYMALGERLIDADGIAHRMAGLLPVTTSFAEPRRTLGYRRFTHDGPLFPRALKGHEFHYARVVGAEGEPLFQVEDTGGDPLGPMGSRVGRVGGSFGHVIDMVA
ncbi:cobyrinate a,c-diamide synthase [Acuticoccus mangrovi]|uniref:Hydrogenobyrinate a,c-diamide synthase n=1 Tax=Acuticoccus mangrovi TaxID=2796142 RepID=A0A934IRH9_9HYPH|nr:cobyrinate a,c-diamide synthase [Acuticoccus mangrovi]MBJ3777308.1 cobyrinate a,c-diamide synthase [Acuticoccus mangrovi]